MADRNALKKWALSPASAPARRAGTEPAEDGGKAGEDCVVIYMDDYRKAQAMNVATHHRYDEELLAGS